MSSASMFYDAISPGSQLTSPHLAPALAIEENIKSSIIAWEVKYIFEGSIKAGMEIL